MEKLLESKTTIRFPDCDPFNHLNNAKYIDYIINSREDQLMTYYQFDVYKLAREKGISWVVAQNQLAYFRPATLMETVVIQTQLLKFDEKGLLVEATMWDAEKKVLKCLYWAKLVHYNILTQKSEIHSPDLMDLFRQIENPLPEPLIFEKRVEQIKSMNHHAKV